MLIRSLFFGVAVVIALVESAKAQEDISLQAPAYSGSGCPQGSVSASLSPDNRALSILFDSFRMDAGTDVGIPENRANCNIRLNMTIPDGFALEVTRIDYRGFVDLTPGTEFSLITDAFWMPMQGRRLEGKRQGPLSEPFTISHEIRNTAIGTCKRDQTLAFNTEMVLKGQTVTTYERGPRGVRIPKQVQMPVQGHSQAALDSADISQDGVDDQGSIYFAIQLKPCGTGGGQPATPGVIDAARADMLTNLLYEAILFRSPDYSGIYTYRNLILSQGINGLRRAGVVLITSPEWKTVTLKTYGVQRVVEQLYEILLGRAVDPSGMQTYSNLILRGQQDKVIDALIMSAEFRAKNLQ